MPFCGAGKTYSSLSQGLLWTQGAEKDSPRRVDFAWVLSRNQTTLESGTWVPGGSSDFDNQHCGYSVLGPICLKDEHWPLRVQSPFLSCGKPARAPSHLGMLVEFLWLSNDSWMRPNRLGLLFLYSLKNGWGFSCSRKEDSGRLTLHVGCWLTVLTSRNNETAWKGVFKRSLGCPETPCVVTQD